MYRRFEDFITLLYLFMNVNESFRALRTVGKCTSGHLFSYGGFYELTDTFKEYVLGLMNTQLDPQPLF